MQELLALIERAALRVESGNWRVCDDSGRLHSGWIIAAFYESTGLGIEYRAAAGFREFFAPAIHRNDGLRTSESAADKGMRLGRPAAAAAIRAYGASLAQGVAA
jgi:hypothetical protein